MRQECASIARMPTTEHILLESDLRQVPDLRNARKIHAQLEHRSRLRRRILQLAIIDYYYLSVCARSGATRLEYVLDLRFLATPRLSRRIAWRWIAASILLLALAAGFAARISSAAIPWWQHDWLRACATVLVMWMLVTLVAAYRTTETVSLRSIHGSARLLEFTGGLGTFRLVRVFVAKLAAHIQLASAARRRTKPEQLRDEMREHLRLRETGLLSAEDYERAKLRILAQHSPATPSSTKRPG